MFSAGLAPEDLGFSLAPLAPGAPLDLEGLAALVEARSAGISVALGKGEGRQADELASIVGPSRCEDIDAPLRVAGHPLRLVAVAPDPVTQVRLMAGREHLQAGRFPEARYAFTMAALDRAAWWPRPLLGTGESYIEEERWTEAIAVYTDAVSRFPWSAEARAYRGYALRKARHRFEAIEELGRALALAPRSRLVRAWLADDRLAEVRPEAPPPAMREEAAGVVHWYLTAGDAADPFVESEGRAYAACKEAFRRSPELRRAATGEAMPSWRWSPAEEHVCSALWVRAYLKHREGGRPADPALDDLWDIAQRGFLGERALYDVGERVHEAAGALLEPARRERLFRFVTAHRVIKRESGGWFFP